jgi:hypothetical protein
MFAGKAGANPCEAPIWPSPFILSPTPPSLVVNITFYFKKKIIFARKIIQI